MTLRAAPTWRRYLSMFLLTVVCIPSAVAGSRSPRFAHIGVAEGLSQSSVTSIAQDHFGYIWMGTQDGLNRYDGYSVQVLKGTNDDPRSLSDNFILGLFVDRADRMWVRTRHGLNRYDHETGLFQRYREGDAHGLVDDTIRGLAEDGSGRLWALSGNALQCYDETNDVFKAPTHRDVGAVKLFAGSNGFWVAAHDGIYAFNPDTGRFVGEPLTPGVGPVARILERPGPDGACLWVAYENSGLVCWSLEKGLRVAERADPRRPGTLPTDQLKDIFFDRGGRLWVATELGLALKDPGDTGFETLPFRPNGKDGMSIGIPSILYEDDRGMLWIGGAGGAVRHNPATEQFGHYREIAGEVVSGAGDDVESLMQDGRGNLWVSIYNAGLFRYNPETNAFGGVMVKSLVGQGISFMLETAPDQFLLASRGGGVVRFHAADGKETRLLPSEEYAADSFNILYADRHDNLWLGSYGYGLFRLAKDGRMSVFRNKPRRNDSLSDDAVWSLLETDEGKLWVGTYAGLNLLDVETGLCRRYQNNPEDPASLSNNGVGALCYDRDGRLWVGTDGGLNRFVPETQNFVRYMEGDGLGNAFVYGILLDEAGNLWMSTNNGLSCLNPETETFRNYTYEDGLQHREFNSGASFKGVDGLLMFGGIEGFNAFYPRDISPPGPGPRMVLQQLRLFNEPVAVEPGRPDALLPLQMEAVTDVTLTHNQNVFSLVFAGLDYADPQGMRYAYKLDGLYDNWIYSDPGDRRASFTNLNAGTYTFKVKGALKNDTWSETPAVLRLKILPAPWKSPWAYSLYLLAGVCLAVGFASAHRRIRQALERMVVERTAELAAKNEALDRSNGELAALDDIVTTINREVAMENLLNTLLEQGCLLIPNAEKGNFLMYDEEIGAYRIFATLGFDFADMQHVVFSFEELVARYVHFGRRIGEGLHLINPDEDLPGQKLMAGIPQPLSMMVVEISVEGNLSGVLVLDNYSTSHAFDQVDRSTLARFRNHAISAVAKAGSFKALEEMNQDILTRQKQLLTQQRMASLGTLTAGVAHELRNPLNFINGLSEVSIELLGEMRQAIEEGNLAQAVADLSRNLDIIYKNGKRANGIVESMMSLSCREGGRMERSDLNHLVAETVKLVYNGVKAQRLNFDVALVEHYHQGLPHMRLVPQNFSRVMINLLNNALESLFEKRAYQSGFVPVLEVTTRLAGDRIEVEVHDNGMGIPQRDETRIFDYFYTTRSPDKGNIGLGLPVSYDIIKQDHGGTIRVDSEEGCYARFIISMPINL